MQNTSGGKSALGLDSNITALIGYIIGIVAIVSIIIEKENKWVRFHAFQSLLYHVAFIITAVVFGVLIFITIFISGILTSIVGLLFFLVWVAFFAGLIFLAFKSYKGENIKLPVIGEMAEKWSK